VASASDCSSESRRRCSQQLPNPKSVAVRGSEQSLPCSLDEATSYIVYIPTYSAAVHIIYYRKPRTRVAQNPKPTSDIPNIHHTAFLFQFGKFITHTFTTTFVYLNTLYQLKMWILRVLCNAKLHCQILGVSIPIYTLDSKNPNFSLYLPLNYGDGVFKGNMTFKSSYKPTRNFEQVSTFPSFLSVI